MVSVQRRSVLAIFAVFMLNSFVLGNWITRIPDVKERLSMSDTLLGVCLLALPLATLLAFTIAGRIIDGSGLRNACRLWLPLYAMLYVLPGLVSSTVQLFLALFLCGVALGLCEVVLNTKADEIEQRFNIRIMSRCHGFWSLGSMFGALLASGFAHFGIAVSNHYLIVMPLLALLSRVATSQLPPDSQQAAVSAHTAVFRLPAKSIVLLCLLPLGIMAVEGAFIDWSAVFMRSVLNASALTIGVTYAFFSVVMAVGRLSGDVVAARFGDVVLVRWSGLFASVGIATFALAQNTEMAFIGATLSGLGVAVVYPLAISAAARRPGRAADNVAAMSLFAFTVFMLAPPIIGFVSDWLSLRVGLVLLAPLAALTALLASEIGRDVAAQKPTV